MKNDINADRIVKNRFFCKRCKLGDQLIEYLCHDMVKHELQVTSHELRIKKLKSTSQNSKVQGQILELRVQIHELRIQIH